MLIWFCAAFGTPQVYEDTMTDISFDIETLEISTCAADLDDSALEHAAGSQGDGLTVAAYTGCSPGTGRYQPC
jgi:hypothetical protein